jgi:hypothetical protein
MTLPNFLILGAPKAGTTTLHNVLSQHPEVYMCPVKEAGFFWAYGQEIQWRGPGTEKLRNRLVNDLGAYEKLFEPVTDQKAIGESSVRYLASPEAPKNIKKFIPQARLIVSLRNPAERAFSAFTHNIRDGLEPCTDFGEALEQERKGLRDNWMFCRYLDRGFYYRSLRTYLEFFDRKQMHVSLLEDLQVDAPGLVRQLFTFLEVDESFIPDASHKHNASGIIRNPVLRLLWTRTNRLRMLLRPLLNDRFRHAAFEWVIRDLEKPPFPEERRAELIEYYREDILKLQDLLQRDLSRWLGSATANEAK